MLFFLRDLISNKDYFFRMPWVLPVCLPCLPVLSEFISAPFLVFNPDGMPLIIFSKILHLC